MWAVWNSCLFLFNCHQNCINGLYGRLLVSPLLWSNFKLVPDKDITIGTHICRKNISFMSHIHLTLWGKIPSYILNLIHNSQVKCFHQTTNLRTRPPPAAGIQHRERWMSHVAATATLLPRLLHNSGTYGCHSENVHVPSLHVQLLHSLGALSPINIHFQVHVHET